MLVFDDDQTVFFIIKYILEERGWEVINATQSQNATALIVEHMPSMIIMDNNIPSIGGVAAIKQIKKNPELHHIPIIFCTGSWDIEKLANNAGADAFIAKPFSLDKLYDTIARFD